MGSATRLLPFAAGILAAAAAFAEDTFRFVPATVRAMEGVGSVATLSVVRKGDLGTDATVDVFTEDDIALAGIDYIAVSNTLSFAAGVATNTVAIPLLDNGNVRSGDVSLFVRLRNPSPGTALGVPANATVVILEDDIKTWACGRSVHLSPASGAWSGVSDDEAIAHLQNDFGLLWEISGEDVLVDTFERVDAEELLVPETAFLFLQGGTSGLPALRDFLAANRNRLESWVRAGGHLLVNASPDSGTAVLPFGALLRGGTASDSTTSGTSADDALFRICHAIGTDWTPTDASRHTSDAVLDLDAANESFQRPLLGTGGGLVATAAIGCGSVTLAALHPATHIECVAEGRSDTGLQLWRNLLHLASDITDPLYVTECPVFEMSGIVGDWSSFSPPGKVFAVQNWSDDMDIPFSAQCDAEWIVLDPASPSGTISPNSQVSLTVLPTPVVASYPVGEYETALVILNESTGHVLRRRIRLVVNPVPGTLAPPADSIAPFDDRRLPFGSVPLGASASATITLSNTDPEHGVRIRNLYYSGDDAFGIYLPDVSGFEVPAAESVTLTAVYSPGELGNHTAVFGFTTDDPDMASLAFQLTGTALTDTLVLDAPTPLSFAGHPGFLPAPSIHTCTITNRAAQAASWRLRRLPEWIAAEPASGTVPTGGSAAFTLSPTAAAAALAEGHYSALISFTNLTTHVEQTLAAELTIFTAPRIHVSPASLAFTNLMGGSSSQILSVANLPDADAALDYSLFLLCKGAPEPAATATGGVATAAAVAESARSPRNAAASSSGEVRELIVRFDDDGATGGARRATGARTALRSGRTLRSRPDMAVVPVPEGESAAEAIAEIRAMPGVRAVQPNYRYHALAIPNDPQFPKQWGLANAANPGIDIHAAEGWDIAASAGELIVAVIDSGADLDHPDLMDNFWVNPGEIPDNGVDDDGNGWVDDVHGANFLDSSGNPEDDHGHGTHCCGIVGARGNNGVGVCGVCWRVRLMPLKFLDNKGVGTTADAIDAIDYAVAHGASVINASWGSEPDEDDELLREAIGRAGAAGVLFVCAAGNDGVDIDEDFFSPASFEGDNIVTVVNMSKTGKLSQSSNYGATRTHLAAPGTSILSTYHRGTGYLTLSGTSMASPHVAGAAALVRALHPELSPADVKTLLLDTVTRSERLAGRCSSGGYLDLHAALGVALGTNAWLTAGSEGGTLAVGEDDEIVLTASAAGLEAGTYRGFVHIRSNDLDAPDTVVEVTHVVLRPSRIEDAAWRARYGLPDDDSADDADFDDDGFTNVEEWLLGTDPTDAESVFRILRIELGEDGAVVVWASATNRVYRVLSTDDLRAPFAPITGDIPGTAPSTRYLDGRTPLPGARFYRVETTVP